jgi:hypothetical protein
MRSLCAAVALLAGCATAPEPRPEAEQMPLEPGPVHAVMVAERDALFALVESLTKRATDRLFQLGHPITELGWPVEVQLREPQMSTAGDHARICVKLVGRVVRPQGRFAAVEVPVERCREATIYNPATMVDVDHPQNRALYDEALDALIDTLSRHARVRAKKP